MKLVRTLDDVISKVERNGVNSLDEYISDRENVSKEIIRCASDDPDIESILIVKSQGDNFEVVFSFCENVTLLTFLQSYYGVIDINYNYRENYTEFCFSVGGFFIKNVMFFWIIGSILKEEGMLKRPQAEKKFFIRMSALITFV